MGCGVEESGSTAIRSEAPPEELVKGLFARISEVSTLPAVAMRIIQVANDSSTGAADLLDAVQYDAAIAARIMRTVNSSYYAMQNKVADLKLAITLLGFKEIRNLAMTAYVSQLFKKKQGYGTYTREGLWNHMIGVGIVARLIADVTRKAAPREAYLAGLLHDLGFILIDQYLNKPFHQLIDSLTEDRGQVEVEAEILGFDHAALGAYVGSQWRLPEHLVATIEYHHDPLAYAGEQWAMVYTVALADFFCNAKGVSPLGIRNTATPPSEVFSALGLQKSQVNRIWSELDDALKAADIMALIETP
jgi:HD-like signal output (HDOD) protein